MSRDVKEREDSIDFFFNFIFFPTHEAASGFGNQASIPARLLGSLKDEVYCLLIARAGCPSF